MCKCFVIIGLRILNVQVLCYLWIEDKLWVNSIPFRFFTLEDSFYICSDWGNRWWLGACCRDWMRLFQIGRIRLEGASCRPLIRSLTFSALPWTWLRRPRGMSKMAWSIAYPIRDRWGSWFARPRLWRGRHLLQVDCNRNPQLCEVRTSHTRNCMRMSKMVLWTLTSRIKCCCCHQLCITFSWFTILILIPQEGSRRGSMHCLQAL